MQVSKVLVVEGDRAARDALVTCLKFVGMEAHGAENVTAARSWLTTACADVLVLSDELCDGAPADIVVHGADSAKTCVLVLTHGTAAAIQSNYPIDDLLRRPIAVSRVVERVEMLIQERALRQAALLRFGALALDMANEHATAGDRKVELSHTEARLLAFFFGLPDRVFSRAQLLQRLWPSNARVERISGMPGTSRPCAGPATDSRLSSSVFWRRQLCKSRSHKGEMGLGQAATTPLYGRWRPHAGQRKQDAPAIGFRIRCSPGFAGLSCQGTASVSGEFRIRLSVLDWRHRRFLELAPYVLLARGAQRGVARDSRQGQGRH
jgi:DNA-binding response OmpR family regulator